VVEGRLPPSSVCNVRLQIVGLACRSIHVEGRDTFMGVLVFLVWRRGEVRVTPSVVQVR